MTRFKIKKIRIGQGGHLKLNLTNKTANINGKTGQFTTKCMDNRVIALKWQMTL